jgi:hypothetical protein
LTGRAEACGDDERAGAVIFGRARVGKTRLAQEAAATASRRGWSIPWIRGTAAAQAVPLGAFRQWADPRVAHPLQLGIPVMEGRTPAPAGPTSTVTPTDRRPAGIGAWRANQSAVQYTHVAVVARQRVVLARAVTQERASRRLVRTDGRWRWAAQMRISASLADLVELQIGSAPEAVREVIDVVAVAEPLELDYLSALAEPSAVEEAETRALISVSPSPAGGPVARVGHPLYAEVRLAQAGYVRLVRLRRRIAIAMTTTERGDGPPDSIRVGLLWLGSDLPQTRVCSRRRPTPR